jgi:hypothetical protein
MEAVMTKAAVVMLWLPRVAGVALSGFLSLFALDAFGGKAFLEALPEFLIHLAPSALLLAIVALAWRLPLVGAAAFPVLALGYAMMVRWRLDWVAVIGGPLVILGVLFFLSWCVKPDSAAAVP